MPRGHKLAKINPEFLSFYIIMFLKNLLAAERLAQLQFQTTFQLHDRTSRAPTLAPRLPLNGHRITDTSC